MGTEYPFRIWFHPAKFWAATKGMNEPMLTNFSMRFISLLINRFRRTGKI